MFDCFVLLVASGVKRRKSESKTLQKVCCQHPNNSASIPEALIDSRCPSPADKDKDSLHEKNVLVLFILHQPTLSEDKTR